MIDADHERAKVDAQPGHSQRGDWESIYHLNTDDGQPFFRLDPALLGRVKINGELHTFGERCPTCGAIFRNGLCAFARITWRDVPTPTVPPPLSRVTFGIDWGRPESEVVVFFSKDGAVESSAVADLDQHSPQLRQTVVLRAGRGCGKSRFAAITLDAIQDLAPHGPKQRTPSELPPWRGETWRRGRRRR